MRSGHLGDSDLVRNKLMKKISTRTQWTLQMKLKEIYMKCLRPGEPTLLLKAFLMRALDPHVMNLPAAVGRQITRQR